MNADTIKTCPKCHVPIPPEAPQGLCPKCLLVTASTATEAGQRPDSNPPPSREAVAAVFPQLEILELIGKGGMGVVFKARQPRLDRLVALKLLPQNPGADPAFAERFNREARVLARLSHPNIVAVHDFGQAGPFFYLLMEFVDGVNLRQAMRAGRFTPPQALALVPKICDALQYAHEEGVLHRDIKPENLLLDMRGRLKIADFGIAKLLGDAKDITLTASGSTIGTPHYMAPEQLERPHDVDQRADIYSLGVVFYEMLTGELPIGRFAPPSEKAPMDPRVDQVVLRTLEKERERRFQSAGDVKTQVEQITASPAPERPGTEGPGSLGSGGPGPPLASSPTAPVGSSSPATVGWSIRAIAGAALVGLSLLEFALVLVSRGHIGPSEFVVLSMFIGFPAVTGSILSWRALRDLRARQDQRRGGRLALLSAVAWPLLVADLVILLVPLLLVESFQWQVLRARSHSLTAFVAAVLSLAVLAFDVLVIRRVLRRWNGERELPHVELKARLSGFSRLTLWVSGFAFAVLALLLVVSRAHMSRLEESVALTVANEPGAPPGFEVSPGGTPGNDNHIYRSALTVPPGYALTIAAVLCSNQLVLKTLPSNTVASVMAPEGPPVQANLSWRLLGNTTFADGAPLQFSLALLQGQDRAAKSFHLVPPEPVAVDWVAEPPQLWPPQNGHTRFLLVKGSASNLGADAQPPAEWSVGVELRLDPIPATLLDALKDPVIHLGSNWVSAFENGLTPSTVTLSPTAEDPASLAMPPEKPSEER